MWAHTRIRSNLKIGWEFVLSRSSALRKTCISGQGGFTRTEIILQTERSKSRDKYTWRKIQFSKH